MYNNNSVNITPKIIRGALWGIAAIVLLVVAMAFIRPWYNVWSQEMEGKAEFAKAEQNRKIKIEEAKAKIASGEQPAFDNSTPRPRSRGPRERPRQSVSRTAASPLPISSIYGCASSRTSATRQ